MNTEKNFTFHVDSNYGFVVVASCGIRKNQFFNFEEEQKSDGGGKKAKEP